MKRYGILPQQPVAKVARWEGEAPAEPFLPSETAQQELRPPSRSHWATFATGCQGLPPDAPVGVYATGRACRESFWWKPRPEWALSR